MKLQILQRRTFPKMRIQNNQPKKNPKKHLSPQLLRMWLQPHQLNNQILSQTRPQSLKKKKKKNQKKKKPKKKRKRQSLLLNKAQNLHQNKEQSLQHRKVIKALLLKARKKKEKDRLVKARKERKEKIRKKN